MPWSGKTRTAFLDTLALACFRTGDVQAAARHQREAIELLGPDQLDPSLVEQLATYEAALTFVER